MDLQGLQIGGYAPAAGIFAEAAALIEAPDDIALTTWAEDNRRLDNAGGGRSGPFNFDETPYLREPQDLLASTAIFTAIVLMGGAQSGKTEVILNWIGHTVAVDPADMLILHPDKELVREFMVARLGKMLAHTDGLPRTQVDNVFEKRFRGASIYGVWPVGSQLRQRPIPRWVIDDLDNVPEDIEKQGSAKGLLIGRQTTFEGRDKSLMASSPSLGKTRGIEAEYMAGTRKVWHWPCPSCGEYFAPAWGQVHVESDAGELIPVEEAAITSARGQATAALVCPANGCVIAGRHKRAMNRAGVWVGPLQTVADDGTVSGPEIETAVASYHLHGLIGLSSWGRLVKIYLDAWEKWQNFQDESELRTFTNTGLGQNYQARVGDGDRVEADALVARAATAGYVLKTVPPWAVCLTAAVDIQGNRFEVLVTAWGVGFESAVVDRFAILSLDDGVTAINPGRHAEHWGQILQKVIWRRYPLAGDARRSMPILNTAIDTGGVEGVTNNAFQFWHTAIGAGVPVTAITLVKGGSNPKGRLLPPPTIDAKRKMPGFPDPELFLPNVNRVKDILAARLALPDLGPGFVHLPADMDAGHVAEITAENKVNGIWEKTGFGANETWDLLVYNLVALMRHGTTDGSLAWVPAWARPEQRPATDPAIDAATDPAIAPAAGPAPVQAPANAVRPPQTIMRRDF